MGEARRLRRSVVEATAVTVLASLTLALAAGAAGTPPGARESTHLVLTAICAAVSASAAAVAETTARLSGRSSTARTGGALAVYGLVVVPAGTVPLRDSAQSVAVVAVEVTGGLAVALLLLSTAWPRRGRPTAWPSATATAAFLLLVGCAALAADRRVRDALAAGAWPDRMLAAAWLTAAVALVARGVRTPSAALVRSGIGAAVVAGAHAVRAGHGGPAAAGPDVAYAGLRLLGVAVVVLALLVQLQAEMRRHDRERAQLLRDREAADTARRTMAARDHEMRNSLLMVSAATHVLFGDLDEQRDDPGAPEHAALRAALHAELGRLRHFLSPREADARGHAAVAPLLAQVAELRKAGGTHIDVDCPDRVAAELPPAELAHAVTNLVANCARHAPGSPVEIHVRVEPGDEAHPEGIVHIEVRDHGPGIPDGSEEEVFRPRHRSSDSSGSGLGLDISRRRLAQYGGTLHLLPRGVTGGGCVAVLRVPARAAQEPSPAGNRTHRRPPAPSHAPEEPTEVSQPS